MRRKITAALMLVSILVTSIGGSPQTVRAAETDKVTPMNDVITADVKIDANNFPDEIFRGIVSQYDTNNNQILSREEIEEVIIMNVANKGIASLEGINYFTSLEELNCENNKLISLDVSRLSQLQILECAKNELTSLYVKGLARLKKLLCGQNQLTKINLSGLDSLTRFDCLDNQLTSLDVTGLKQLENLDCSKNAITSLHASGLKYLEFLYVGNNQLTTLDLSGLVRLKVLECANNQLETIDVSKNTRLATFSVSSNQLISLDVSMLDANIAFECNKNIREVYAKEDQTLELELPSGFGSKLMEITGADYNSKTNTLKIQPGVYQVTYKYDVGHNKTAEFVLNITDTRKVSITPETMQVYVSDQELGNVNLKETQVTAKLMGFSSSNITWSTEDSAVAKVDSEGFIIPMGYGTTNIVVTAIDDITKEEITGTALLNIYKEVKNLTIDPIPVQLHTGSFIEPTVVVKADGVKLDASSYTCEYEGNKSVGEATITIKGNSPYNFTVTHYFNIAEDFTKVLIYPTTPGETEFDFGDMYYTGKHVKPTFTVKYGEKTLVDGVDYKATYENYIAVKDYVEGKVDYKTPKITIVGIGDYSGTIIKYYSIKKRPYSPESINVNPIEDQVYTGQAIIPAMKIVNRHTNGVLGTPKDYTVTVKDGTNHTDVGTVDVLVTFNGNYTGSYETSFNIVPMSLTSDQIQIENQGNPVYSGSDVYPELMISYDRNGEKVILVDGKDYEIVSGSNSIVAGSADATIRLIGNYSGEKTFTYHIGIKDGTSAEVTIANQTYTGGSIVPEAEVRDGANLLIPGKDYSIHPVSNENNTVVGVGYANIVFQGNYSGIKKVAYNIVPKALTEQQIEVSDISDQIFTGTVVKPDVVVKDNTMGTELVLGTDYRIMAETITNTQTGTAYMTILLQGNYSGSKEVSFTILPKALLEQEVVIKGLGQKVYTGNSIMPNPIVIYKDLELECNKDYVINPIPGRNNTDVGTAYYMVSFIGNYSGEKQIQFEIVPRAVESSLLSISMVKEDYEYTGGVQLPEITVNYAGVPLVKDIDYIVEPVEEAEEMAVGEAYARVTFIKNHMGSRIVAFTIVKKELNESNVMISNVSNVEYTKEPTFPTVSLRDTQNNRDLVFGIDYILAEVEGKNSTVVGEAYAKVIFQGNYSGELEVAYTIDPRNISHKDIMITPIENQEYTGEELYPELEVYDGATQLVSGADYTVAAISGENNINVGEAKIVLLFSGNYSGTQILTFTIDPQPVMEEEIIIDTNAIDALVYTGDKILPQVPVSLNERQLEYGVDYVVEAVDGRNCVNAGAAYARVRLLGNYAGVREFEFEIAAYAANTDEILVSGIVDQAYTGEAIFPGVKVFVNSVPIGKNDYRMESIPGKNNVKHGDAYAMLVLQNNYSGSVEIHFTIKSSITLLPTDLVVEEVTDQYYTGAEIYPEILLMYGGNELVNGEDYKLVAIEGENNTEIGAAKVRAELLKKYDGSTDVEFTIIPRPLTKEEVTIGEIADVTYNGNVQMPTLTMNYLAISLQEGMDYDLQVSEGKNATNVGEATATVAFKGNFSGSFEVSYSITKKALTAADIAIGALESQVYTGDAILPMIQVTDANNPSIQYVQGEDYELVPLDTENCVNVGTAKVAYEFKGNYEGNGTVTFEIEPKAVTEDEIEIIQLEDSVYSGLELLPVVTVRNDGRTLVSGKDYDIFAVSMKNCVNAGNASVEIRLKGNYSGSKEFEYQILTKELQDTDLTVTSVSSKVYSGNVELPEMTVMYGDKLLIAGEDYTIETVEGNDNVNAGTKEVLVRLKDNYTGSKMVSYEIIPMTLATENTTVQPIKNQEFTGTAIVPDTIIYANGVKLVAGKDYIMDGMDSLNNREAGEAYVAATFVGNYSGSRVIPFTIIPKTLSEHQIEMDEIQPETYTGNEITPFVVVKDGDAVLENGRDYKVSAAEGYQNKKAGTAVVKITLCGNYSGSRTAQFTILPRELRETEVVVADIPNKTYTGSEILPASKTMFGEVELVHGVDYEVMPIEKQDCTNQGTAIVRYQFKGNYSGSKDVMFKILAHEVVSSMLNVAFDKTQIYTGGTIFPEMQVSYGSRALEAGKDYQVVAVQGQNNTNVGTAIVKIEFAGNYCGYKEVSYVIQAKPLVEEMLTIKKQDEVVYTGKNVLPELTIMDQGTILKFGIDYTVSAMPTENNKNVGEAKVLVEFKENYSGRFECEYTIVAKHLSKDEIDVKEIEDQVYSGENIYPALVVKDGNISLSLNKDYVIEKIDGVNSLSVGQARLNLKLIGNYSGSREVSFNIIRKNVVGSEIVITEFDDETVSNVITIPEVIVWDGEEQLKENVDYTVEIIKMPNGMNSVKINLKGAHANSPNITYNIITKTIDTKILSITKIEDQLYTGDAVIPKVKIRYGSITLKEGEDYTLHQVEGANCIEAGIAKVKVQFMNSFSGSAELSYKIISTEVDTLKVTLSDMVNPEYTGEKVYPKFSLYYKGEQLMEGSDFRVDSVEGRNQSEAGDARAKITFLGNYSGSMDLNYKIEPKALEENAITIESVTDELQGDSMQLPSIDMHYQGKSLVRDRDYVLVPIAGEDYSNVGTPVIKLKFIGNYSGEKELSYRIVGDFVLSEDMEVEAEDVMFANKKVLPKVNLLIKKQLDQDLFDYTIEIVKGEDSVNAGIVKAKIVLRGYYAGTKEFTFKILPKVLDTSSVVTNYGKEMEYTGEELLIKDMSVSYGDWKLNEGKDFTLERIEGMDYRSVGTKKLMLTFCGSYEGTNPIEVSYTIKPKPVVVPPVVKPVTKPINSSGMAIAVTGTLTFTGKTVNPYVKVTDSGKVLKNGTDYRTVVSNNLYPGTGKVVITGIGSYSGSVTKTFKIEVPKVANLVTKSSGAKEITITWNKQSGVSGYEVYAYHKKTKKYILIKRVWGANTNTYTDKKLAAVTDYQYMVKSFKGVNGKNVYGAWSNVLKTSTAPAAPKLTVTPAKKALTAKWKKITGATGYEVYYSTSKNGKYTLLSDVKKQKTVSATKKSLVSKKKYYVKMRTYRTVAGKKIYSGYSNIVTTTVK